MSDTDYLKDIDLDAIADVNERQKVVRKALAAIKPTAPVTQTSRVLLTCASDVVPEAISWLWRYWLPAGKLTLLAGSPGTGKTTIALSLAAMVSKGNVWPDGAPNTGAGTVLMWSSEDNPADTLVPRLIAAGADLKRIHFISNVAGPEGEILPFDPARDIGLLGERLAQMGGATLLILDPIVSAVAGDAHRVNDVRRDLQALVDMAGAYRCAVLGISHFAKGGKGTSPAERVIGSQAFVALARMVLVAAKDEAAERRILARAKSNIAPDDGGIAYTLEQVDASGIEASRVVWGALIEGSARDILGDVEETDDDAKSELDEAGEFLLGLLADGPMSSKDVRSNATGAGYAWRTIERAKRLFDIQAKKESHGGWKWHPPGQDRHRENQDRHSHGSGGLGGLGGVQENQGLTEIAEDGKTPKTANSREDRQDRQHRQLQESGGVGGDGDENHHSDDKREV
ncbi:AAA family ATPase [Robbsia andropogonis]|uniref:AAA family ATPase n=1 Tax=Robbsia andropogonis TaxID=28092 RepID=UPI002A6B1B94|nr:AAA family ATPase [Robbsia andropogonis]